MEDTDKESVETCEEAEVSETATTIEEGSETADDDSMMKEDTDSQTSESSGTIEEFDDVNRLVVKISKEDVITTVEAPPEQPEEEAGGGVLPTLREKDEDESTRDDVSSLKTEEGGRTELESNAEEDALHKEEERREKMKVLLSGYLESKTKKEIEKALLNEKRIISQWLYPFRASYQREWATEMQKLKLAFTKALDYKKSHIHAIQRERKLVELNHLWADSAHYRTTEELFDFMRMRCDKLKNRYLEDLEETKQYYLEREREVVEKCTRAEDRARVLALMRKEVHLKTMRATHDTLEHFRLEGEHLREEEAEGVKGRHLTHVEAIARELQTSISPPEHRMDEIRALFEEWNSKYQDFLKTSERNRRDLAKFGEEIPTLEAKVAEARRRLEELRRENKITKQKENDEVGKLKKIARRYESLRPSLRKMITASEEVMAKLRERKGKLDKIAKLKRICDQLEIESRAHFDTSVEKEGAEEEEEEESLALVREVCSEDIEDPGLLKCLHRKITLAEVQNQYLRRELDNLKVENMAMRTDMKKYLHLITSGEWKRASDAEFEALLRFTSSGKKPRDKESADTRTDYQRNLELLNRSCRPLNDKIIERIEKM